MGKKIVVTAVVVLALFIGFTAAMAADEPGKKPVVPGKPDMEKKPVVPGKPDAPEKKPVVPGKPDAPEKKADAPAKQDPARAKVLNLLKGKSDDAAINQAKGYLAKNPEDADVLNLLAEAYANKDNLAGAEAAVNQAIALHPQDPYSKKIQAKINMLKAVKEGNFDLALQNVNSALSANPNDSALLSDKRKIYEAAAKTYISRNERAKANEALDAAIALSDAKQKSDLLAMKEMANKPVATQPKPKE